MDDKHIFGKSIAFPPRIGPDGRWAWSQGPQNVRESIRIILLTDLQERLMVPDFGAGFRPFLFEPNIVVTHRLIRENATRALTRWEPRIEIQSLTVEPNPEEPQQALLNLVYRLVAMGTVEQFSLTLQFAS